MGRNCDDINIPTTDESQIACCEIIGTDCISLSKAVPCLQAGKGKTLTYMLDRLCSNLGKIKDKQEEQEDKINFYAEHVESRIIAPDVIDPTIYFLPISYTNLEYQNATNSTITVEVHVSFDVFGDTSNGYKTNISGAIIKTDTLNVDTIQYESFGSVDLDTNRKDDNNRNVSFFKVLTLLPLEKVSLKFKSVPNDKTQLTKAQILIKQQ